jgi:hypothetical protein
MQLNLQRMFTVGTAGSRDYDGSDDPILIFHDEEGIHNVEEEAKRLLQEPFVQKVFPHGGTIRRGLEVDATKALVISGSLSDEVLPMMGEPGEVLVWDANGIRVLDTYETYYACKLPVRTFLGCAECVSTTGKDDDATLLCSVARQIHASSFSDAETFTAEEAAQCLKSRKSVVGGYTYVSPRLTTTANESYTHLRERNGSRHRWGEAGQFSRTYRPAKSHDFSIVDDRSADISLACKESGRRKRFRATECETCMAKQACRKQDYQSCVGPYTQSVAEMEKLIIQNTNWEVWEDWQIRFILERSGLQDKRVNRRLMWLTFNEDGYVELKYARASYGSSYALFKNWDEFHPYFLELDVEQHEVSRCQKRPLPVGTRGALAAISKIHYSPSRGWGGGRHPRLGIDARRTWGSEDAYIFSCIWNRGGRATHYPTTEIREISEVYEYNRRIPNVEKTEGPNTPALRRRYSW